MLLLHSIKKYFLLAFPRKTQKKTNTFDIVVQKANVQDSHQRNNENQKKAFER